MDRREGGPWLTADASDVKAAVAPAALKLVMRRMASTVSIITSSSGGVLNGMTATAVCSVSADPPSLLVVVNKANRSHALIESSRAFTVNVLTAGEQAMAAHFASAPSDPLAVVGYSLGPNKCPILARCAAYLACVVEQQYAFGTHSIFIGKVIECGSNATKPLIYYDGSFCSES